MVGTVVLGAMVAGTSGRLLAPELKGVPWYAWIGGIYGAFFVAIAAFAAPRVGVGVLLTAAIAGQLLAAVALDHYGFFGLERQPVNLARAAGIGLVLIGAVLVRRG
jgi:bacterial/archaeal transporter family-2 protein